MDGKLKEKSLQDINESYHSDIPFQNTVNIVYEINSNDKLKLNVKLEKKNSGFSILKDQETNYQSSFDCVEDISHFPKTKSSFDQDYNEKMNKKTSPHKGSYEIMNSNERNTLNSPKKNEQTLNSTNKTTLNAPKRNALHFSKTVHLEYSFLNNDFKDLNDNLKAQSIRSKILQNSLRQNDKIQDSMFFDESIEKKVETNEENNFPENLNFGLKRYIFEETIDDLKQNLENIEEKTKKNNNKCEQLEDIQSFEKQQNNPLEYTTQINWEYLFYQTIKETLAEQLDYNKMMTSGLHLIEIIKEFQGFCKNIMKNIVTEFVLPKEKRKYLPIIEKPDILIYNLKEEKVIIKLVGLKEKKFENFISNFKALGNEYRANIFVLNRILSNMKENSKDTHFKVPLCCLIDYFGFRCLIYCKPNGIDGDKTLALGFDSKNNYQKNILLDDKIITSLSNILTIKVFLFIRFF